MLRINHGHPYRNIIGQKKYDLMLTDCGAQQDTSWPLGCSIFSSQYRAGPSGVKVLISLWPAISQRSKRKIRVIFLCFITGFRGKGFWSL
jgi:hypothetical protein